MNLLRVAFSGPGVDLGSINMSNRRAQGITARQAPSALAAAAVSSRLVAVQGTYPVSPTDCIAKSPQRTSTVTSWVLLNPGICFWWNQMDLSGIQIWQMFLYDFGDAFVVHIVSLDFSYYLPCLSREGITRWLFFPFYPRSLVSALGSSCTSIDM